MVCCWIEDPNSEAFKSHLPRIHDYLWVAEDGMKMQGTDGSQFWDTSFTIQAIVSSNLIKEYSSTLEKAHDYVKMSQPTVLVTLALGIVICQKVHGLSPPGIKDGKFQTPRVRD
ncbi:CRISPR-associated protein 1 [Asimina triloba]